MCGCEPHSAGPLNTSCIFPLKPDVLITSLPLCLHQQQAEKDELFAILFLLLGPAALSTARKLLLRRARLGGPVAASSLLSPFSSGGFGVSMHPSHLLEHPRTQLPPMSCPLVTGR